MSSSEGKLAIELPDSLIEAVTQRVADLLAERQRPAAPDLLTVDEAAELLRSKRQRVYDLISQGRLPCLRDGSRVLIRRTALLEYLEGGST